MVQGKVEICGVNTAKLPLLKAADKDALFAKIREGDTAARESYICLLYTSPRPRDRTSSRMPSSA